MSKSDAKWTFVSLSAERFCRVLANASDTLEHASSATGTLEKLYIATAAALCREGVTRLRHALVGKKLVGCRGRWVKRIASQRFASVRY